MRRNTVKQLGRRTMALALALMLFVQTAPFTAIAANAESAGDVSAEISVKAEETVSDAAALEPAVQEEGPETETAEPEKEEPVQEESVPESAKEEAADTAEEMNQSEEIAAESEPIEAAESEAVQTEEIQPEITPSETVEQDAALKPENEELAEDAVLEEQTANLYDLLAAAEEGAVEVTGAEQLLKGIPAGSTYILKNDITMGSGQQIGVVAGVLDGAGHTITIDGRPLVQELTGTVQNLTVAGKASLQDNEGSIAASVNGGTIQNCASTVAIDMGWALWGGGGLAGRVENGKIYNSYFAGSGRDAWGMIAISGIFAQAGNDQAPAQIANCYYNEGDNVGRGSAWNRDDPSNGKKSLDEMKTPEFAALLNADNVGSGYVWEAVEGALPKLVPGGGALEPCNKTNLEAAIKEAESKKESDYTGESWERMQKALNEARDIYKKIDAVQAEADAAEKALREALSALEEKVRELSPVEPPKTGVISISSKEDLARIDGTDPDAFYQLTQDIVLEGNYLSPNLAGVLDGNGHAIIIHEAYPIFGTITETGVVQNLQVKVEGNFTNRQTFAPYAEKLKGGMIVNCISEVTGQHSAGYVRRMEGGAMVNCLTMGHNRRGAFVYFQKSTDHQNINGYQSGKFYNCYWSASNSVENITPAENLIQCEAVGDERLRSAEFMAQLNSQSGKFGTSWGRDENGYPYFGADQGDAVIDGSQNRYAVEFVWHDDRVMEIADGNLLLSPQTTGANRFAGRFRLKDVPETSTITWSCDDRADQQIMQIGENGDLFVFYDGGAVVRAMEHKADGTKELAAELRVVSASRDIEELRLLLDGNVIENTATVQGSKTTTLEVQAKYAGAAEFSPLPAYLVELTSEKPELLRTDYNTASFYFKEPGTSKLTVTEKTNKENPVSVTISVTSAYVPVKSVKPAIDGTVKIHYRNSMGAGQFVSLAQDVFVEPANASYRKDITVESSDPTIAQYDGSGYTPYQNGTVTFTAKLNDRGRVVEGTSTVNFVYENPLAEVSASEKSITLDQNTKQTLPLVFRGQPGNAHNVTEPNLVWSFDKPGIVSIQRPNPLMQVRNTGGPDDGNWVASTVFEVKGLRPGKVEATGTPVDTTGGAKPIKLTITVNGDGSIVPGFDIPGFIAAGKKTAGDYLKANNTFTFGEEWSIFTLLRDGQTLPQESLDSYYNDVAATVRSWTPNILATEVERTAIALNAMGKDITNVEGVNLVKMICDHPNLTRQGSNSLAWALLALDMKDTEIPADLTWSRESMIAELLTYQNADGGFGLDKSGMSGIDMTAMSLQALAKYRNRSEVANAIQKGVEYLAKAAEQNLNLGNSESIAQVIIALAVLDRDIVADPGFGDDVENLMSELAAYMVEGKGFKHDKNGKIDKMANAQAMQALCAYERFLNGEDRYWDLVGSGLEKGPAEKVTDMIGMLPEKVTLADAHTVSLVRQAYEKLTAEEKAKVPNLNKLEAAEAELKALVSVDGVVQLIGALPDTITLANEAAVQAARTAYDLLTEEQKAQISNLQKLLDAEKTIADIKAAAKVEKLIEALPNPLTIADKAAVQAARTAYEALSAEQKALVKNLDKLIRAEAELVDWDAAQKVMEMIKNLPTEITQAEEEAVKAARTAYQALTEKQQKLVLNLYILERAEKMLEERKAVEAVEDAIEALPDEISLKDADAIKAARAAYNELSPELRKQVKNLDKLKKAEKALRALRKKFEKPNMFLRTETNVVEGVVENGKVSAKQLEAVKGKELVLRVEGTMESGENYVLSIYGKDIKKAADLNVEMKRKGLYEEEIHKLSEEPEIFRFAETGKFPAPIMVQMETALADGEYLLLRYDPAEQRAVLVSRVKAEDGIVQFIVEEGGEYFLAKKASKKSLSELEEAEKLAAEPEQELEEVKEETPAEKTEAENEEAVPVQQKSENSFLMWIWLPVIVLVLGGVIVLIVRNKRKENKGE